MKRFKRSLLVGLSFLLSTLAFSQYGSLEVNAGKIRIADGFNDAGFAGLNYSYHLNSKLALVAGFSYSGTTPVHQFEDVDGSNDFTQEAHFSNQGYGFFLGPELSSQIKESRFSWYLRPGLGLILTSANSELFKIGTIVKDELEDNDIYISDKSALDEVVQSPSFTHLYASVEGGIRWRLGKTYTLSLFTGINNIDYSTAVNNIISSNTRFNMSPVSSQSQFYLGIGMSMPIHGLIPELQTD